MPSLHENLYIAAMEDASANAPIRAVLDDINANLRDVETKLNHRIITIVALALLFGLIQQTSVRQFSALGVTFDNTDVLKLGIPVIVSYLFYSMMFTVAARRVLGDAYRSIFAKLYPALSAAWGVHFAMPLRTTILLSMIREYQTGWRRGIFQTIFNLLIILIFLFPPIFIAYSLIHCVQMFGWNLATIGAILISGAFVQGAFLISGTGKLFESPKPT